MSFKFQHLNKTQTRNEKSSHSYNLRAGEIIMTGATALAMFGPQKFRPWFRHLITIIGVTGTVINLFRRRS